MVSLNELSQICESIKKQIGSNKDLLLWFIMSRTSFDDGFLEHYNGSKLRIRQDIDWDFGRIPKEKIINWATHPSSYLYDLPCSVYKTEDGMKEARRRARVAHEILHQHGILGEECQSGECRCQEPWEPTFIGTITIINPFLEYVWKTSRGYVPHKDKAEK